MIKRLNTDKAPKAIGTYSQGTKVENLVFTSGQIPINPSTGNIILNDFKEEVHQVLNNLDEVLKAGGSSIKDVIKLTIFLTDLSKFTTINEVFLEYFKDDFPSRSVIEVSALPMGANIEIEAIGMIR